MFLDKTSFKQFIDSDEYTAASVASISTESPAESKGKTASAPALIQKMNSLRLGLIKLLLTVAPLIVKALNWAIHFLSGGNIPKIAEYIPPEAEQAQQKHNPDSKIDLIEQATQNEVATITSHFEKQFTGTSVYIPEEYLSESTHHDKQKPRMII